MKNFVLFVLVRLLLAQDINPVSPLYSVNGIFTSVDLYNGQLIAVSPNSINQYDFTTGVLNRTVAVQNDGYCNSFLVYNGSLYFQGLFNQPNTLRTLFQVSLNTFQYSHFASNTQGWHCFLILNDYLYVGTDVSFDLYNFISYQKLTSYPFTTVYDIVVYGQSFLFATVNIEERSIQNLNQLYSTYNGSSSTFSLVVYKDNDLFGVKNNLYMIYQWKIDTKQLVKKFIGHTWTITDIRIVGNFLFTCSLDRNWIQWNIETGQIVRKINTGLLLYGLLIKEPFLVVAGQYDMFKYFIPELVNMTTIAETPFPSTPIIIISTKTSQATQSKSENTEGIEMTSDIIVASATLKHIPTSTLLISKETGFVAPIQTTDMSIFYLIGMIGIVIFLVFAASILLYCLIKRERKKLQKYKTSTTESSSYTSTLSGYEQTTSSTTYSSSISNIPKTSSSYSESDQTLMATKNAYSIPVYLQLKREDIRPIKEIAKGGQGTILLANLLNAPSEKEVIVKHLGMNFDDMNERQQNCFNQELAVIHYFKESPGFVRIYGYIIDPACLILKYYPLGSLENLLKKNLCFENFIMTKSFLILFLKEFSFIISLMHHSGFVHCDIKPQNILLEADGRGTLHPILTDFGITQIVSDKVLKVRAMTVETLKGFSLNYGAPEQIMQLRAKKVESLHPEIIKKRDIYAICGLLYALMEGREPWK